MSKPAKNSVAFSHLIGAQDPQIEGVPWRPEKDEQCCTNKKCFQYFQAHQSFFNEEPSTHKLISIHTYLAKSNFYIKPLCTTHGKEYSMCCWRCFSMICQNCSVASGCIEETGIVLIEMDEKVGIHVGPSIAQKITACF